MSESTTDRWMDRTGWDRGPWDNEPDRIEWRHEGLPCLIVRGPSGALCGYVGVPPGHPWLEGDTPDVTVHGRLTYGSHCRGHICHVPQPGEADDVFWLGFDCAHLGDLRPGSNARERQLGLEPVRFEVEHYRDADYVRREVERLADQVIAARAGSAA